MIGLPASLAPWRAELEVFPAELALSLGAWVPRLAAAVGPFSDAGDADGEPDGYGGIARTGIYERLLHSEWLLADEVPDEFLRRAASGEHAFLALARSRPTGSRRCVVVFDTGPDQLGSPRLAHLALLIVLNRRARVAGAELSWGCAHQPGEWREDVSPGSALHLARARTPRTASADDLRAWSARAGRDADDLWFIGGESLARAAAGLGGSRAQVDDLFWLERETIAVTLHRRGSRPIAVELTVPPRAQAVRLLRDPFAVVRPPPLSSAVAPVGRTARFNGRGDRLIARCTDGTVVGWHVPGSPRAPAGHPRVARAASDEAIVAVQNLSAQEALTFSLRGSSLVVRARNRPAEEFDLSATAVAPPTHPHDLWDVVVRETQETRSYLLLTHAGALLLVCPRVGGAAPAPLLFSGVVALGRRTGRREPFSVWQHLDGAVLGCVLDRGGLSAVWRAPVHPSAGAVVTSATRELSPHALLGLAAVRTEPDRWVVPGLGDIQLSPEGGEVVGVVAEGREAALVVVAADRRSISLRTAGSSRTVLTGDGRIAHVACAAAGSLLAVAYYNGSIRVVSVRDGTERLLIDPVRA